ncbi:MAG: putative DNA-binding protein [Clostridia bacterium]|nr:putative DNA-binding protein [Clostridia bacterium]
MEKKVKVSLLWQTYGKMLTDKQYEVINDYYNNDLSLSEIAENNQITRQAVRDIIKKGENKLFELEEKLAFMEKTLKQEKQLQAILQELSKIEDTSSDKKVAKILEHVCEELNCLA